MADREKLSGDDKLGEVEGAPSMLAKLSGDEKAALAVLVVSSTGLEPDVKDGILQQLKPPPFLLF